jgi:hypothetical protein
MCWCKVHFALLADYMNFIVLYFPCTEKKRKCVCESVITARKRRDILTLYLTNITDTKCVKKQSWPYTFNGGSGGVVAFTSNLRTKMEVSG